jgi:hypothetical protein
LVQRWLFARRYTGDMPRRLVSVILSLVLCCQGFAAMAQALLLSGGDVRHAVAHLTDEAHHHHDDGSFHVDDSDESVQHLLVDLWLGAPAVPVGYAAMPALKLPAVAPPQIETTSSPPPFIEGLRRPPRSTLT